MKLDDWINTLKGPIHVIGNGPLTKGLKENTIGSTVRFNNFELSGEAGWKTTHWVTCAWSDVKDRPLFYPLSPWMSSSASAKRANEFEGRVGKNLVFTETNNHILRWFPDAPTKPIDTWPSTGFCFLALLHYLEFTDVSADGFNALSGGHYWNPSHSHDHQNTAQRELTIIQNEFKFL